MEASGATQTGGGEQTGGEAAPAQQQTGGPDIGALTERFNSFAEDMGSRFDQLESSFDPGHPGELGGLEQPGGFDAQIPPGAAFQDETGAYFDQYGQPVQRQPQQDPQALREEMRKELRAEMSKELEPILEHFKGQELAQLEQQFPEFRDRESADKVVAAADEMAAKLGQPELADSPEFLKMMILAQKGEAAAKSEIPAGAEDNEVQVETASGSNPGASELDPGDRIVKAGSSGAGFFGS